MFVLVGHIPPRTNDTWQWCLIWTLFDGFLPFLQWKILLIKARLIFVVCGPYQIKKPSILCLELYANRIPYEINICSMKTKYWNCILLTKYFRTYKNKEKGLSHGFQENFPLIPQIPIKGTYIGCKIAQAQYARISISLSNNFPPRKMTRPSKMNLMHIRFNHGFPNKNENRIRRL